MNQHPDAKLTIREAYEKHYDKSDLSPATVRTFGEKFRVWEQLSGNPPIGEIDNAALKDFRTKAIEKPYAPSTINSCWMGLRAVLRCVGPAVTGNPAGLGIIEGVLYMKPVPVVHKLPRRVPIEEIEWAYAAATKRTYPKVGFPARAYWQTLIVLLYTAGLRISDALSLRMDQIDLTNGTLDFVARKTGKAEEGWPLHPAAVEHIRRIWKPRRELLLPFFQGGGGAIYWHWRSLITDAGIERKWTFHDLRRTGADECDRIHPGTGRLLLQQAPRNVTERSYLNKLEELREAVHGMRVPDVFMAETRHVREVERANWIEYRTRLEEKAGKLPAVSDPKDWHFRPSMFQYRDLPWSRLSAYHMKALRVLVNAHRSAGFAELFEAVYGACPTGDPAENGWLCRVLSRLRRNLRTYFQTGGDFDPVPCFDRARNGNSAWSLNLPPEALQPVEIEPEPQQPKPDRSDGRSTMLGSREVAEMLGCHPQTVRDHWSRTGQCPAPAIRKRQFIRWRKSDILEWIDAGCPDLREGKDESQETDAA